MADQQQTPPPGWAAMTQPYPHGEPQGVRDAADERARRELAAQHPGRGEAS